jgi:dienelactone hydrolase
MASALDRQDVTFASGGVRCAAWLYPVAADRSPLVILAHGLGATRELRLDAYARRFQAAGFTALVFDYRHYGESEGTPRELLSIGRQLEDWRAAIAFAKTLPGVDPERIALWGSSFGGGHVMTLAAEGRGVAAAISQVPFSDGLASTLALPVLTALRITLAAIVDLVRAAFGLSPGYIGLLGRPGDVALMSAPDCVAGYRQLLPSGLEASGRWSNRVTARTGLAIPLYAPARGAHKIEIPIFIAVAEKDSIAPAGPTIRGAAKAKKAELRRYPAGHFDYYLGDGFEQIVGEEIAFLNRVLAPGGR